MTLLDMAAAQAVYMDQLAALVDQAEDLAVPQDLILQPTPGKEILAAMAYLSSMEVVAVAVVPPALVEQLMALMLVQVAEMRAKMLGAEAAQAEQDYHLLFQDKLNITQAEVAVEVKVIVVEELAAKAVVAMADIFL
jgi:hypothetical protein